MAARWFLLAVLTTSYGAGAFGMLGISPLSPSLVDGFALTRLQVAFIVPSIYVGGLFFSLPGGRLADRLRCGRASWAAWRSAPPASSGTCGAVVALPMALTWRALAPLGSGAPPPGPDDAAATGSSSWWWLGRPALVVFFASGLVLGMVQAAVLSYLPLYAVQALGFDAIGAGLHRQRGSGGTGRPVC